MCFLVFAFRFFHLCKAGMDFDLFRECRSWPLSLKLFFGKALHPDPWRRSTLKELMNAEWVKEFLRGGERSALVIRDFVSASTAQFLR